MLLKKGEIICFLCRGSKRIRGMGNSGQPEIKICPNCSGEGKVNVKTKTNSSK